MQPHEMMVFGFLVAVLIGFVLTARNIGKRSTANMPLLSDVVGGEAASNPAPVSAQAAARAPAGRKVTLKAHDFRAQYGAEDLAEALVAKHKLAVKAQKTRRRRKWNINVDDGTTTAKSHAQKR